MGSNKFNRALGHLKSTSIDERIRQLDEQPTNNTSQIYIDQPDSTTTTELNPNLNPVDLTVGDTNATKRDTSGLFMPDGTILTEEPPGDTSYILGPMAAMYYTWSYPWTMIGYIRQSDRKMVNLGRIDGKLSDWNGTAGNATSGSGTFNSYGQLTLEQAVWFRDIKKQSGASNDPSTYNYYAFYPGPPSQAPDAFGRYPCVITGVPKRRTETISDPATNHARGLDPNWGLTGYMFVKVGDKWEKKYYYGDGTSSSETSGEMTPDNPFYNAYQRGGGDEAAANGYSRNEIIRSGNEQIQAEIDQQFRQEYQDYIRNLPDKPMTPNDFKSAKDYSAYKDGGGDAARMQGKSVEDIIKQGIQNNNQYGKDLVSDPASRDAQDASARAELERLMSKPPGSHTPAEKKALLDAGLDDFVRGGKTQSPLGDLAMLALTYLGVKAGPTKLLQGASTALAVDTVRKLAKPEVSNSSENTLQMLGKLTQSIITGQSQEVKLDSEAKKNQINNVNPQEFERVLQIGTPPKADTNNAVDPHPDKSDTVLTGGWADQGGVEVSYDPTTDSLTITSNKMLRTTSGGNTVQRDSSGKIVSFSDIPKLTPEQIQQGVDRYGLKGPLEKIFSTVGGIDGIPVSQRMDVYNDVTSAMINYAAQGTASNAVALRNALVQTGLAKPSEMERTGGGHGQVFSQTQYKGSEIPKNLRDIINKKTSKTESFGYTRKRILREIKNNVIIPEEKKEKLKGYRPKIYGKLHAQYDTLMQKAENPASFKQMDETTWTKQDKYFNARLSQERKNEVLDHLGTGDHFWEILTETGRKRSEKGLKEKYGDFTLVRKEQLVGDTLLFLVDENGKKETILQSEYSDRIARQNEEHLWEQETLNAPNDPLMKRVRSKLANQIDYPDKPSRMGYPDGPTPQQVAGWHPEYGKRAAYYNGLDPQSADAMPATGDPETDQKVAAQKTPLKPVKQVYRKKGKK